MQIFARQKAAPGNGAAFRQEMKEKDEIEAVSYTHLDVYKRQGRGRPGAAAAGPPSGRPGRVPAILN